MEKHFFTDGEAAGREFRQLGWLGRPAGVLPAFTGFFGTHGYAIVSTQSPDDFIAGSCLLILLDCTGQDAGRVRDLLLALHHLQAGIPVVLLGVAPGSAYEQFVRWPAVQGMFPGDCSEAQLLRGVESILQGQNWLPRRLLVQCLERQRIRPPLLAVLPDALTDRERQILRLVGDAATNAQVAYELRISEHTVKTHLYNIFRKIRVRNRTEASNWVRTNFCETEA